jgi:hypothetical protein
MQMPAASNLVTSSPWPDILSRFPTSGVRAPIVRNQDEAQILKSKYGTVDERRTRFRCSPLLVICVSLKWLLARD